MRIIDADELEKRAYDDLHHHAKIEDWEFDVITNYLDTSPTIEAEPVNHARWEICETPGHFDTYGNPDKYARCSHCGFKWTDLYSVKNYFKGCPKCRAIMDLE